MIVKPGWRAAGGKRSLLDLKLGEKRGGRQQQGSQEKSRAGHANRWFRLCCIYFCFIPSQFSVFIGSYMHLVCHGSINQTTHGMHVSGKVHVVHLERATQSRFVETRLDSEKKKRADCF